MQATEGVNDRRRAAVFGQDGYILTEAFVPVRSAVHQYGALEKPVAQPEEDLVGRQRMPLTFEA